MDWLFVFSQAFTDGHIKGERERGGGREREREREGERGNTPPKKCLSLKKRGKNEQHPYTQKRGRKKGFIRKKKNGTPCVEKKKKKKGLDVSWKNDYPAHKHGKKKAHENKTMRQLTKKVFRFKKKGEKNEQHHSTQKKRWKKGGKNEQHPSRLKKWLTGPHAWEKKGPWNGNNETTHSKKGFC